jgi:hypothetical protein
VTWLPSRLYPRPELRGFALPRITAVAARDRASLLPQSVHRWRGRLLESAMPYPCNGVRVKSQNDKGAIFASAAQAQRAADYLNQKAAAQVPRDLRGLISYLRHGGSLHWPRAHKRRMETESHQWALLLAQYDRRINLHGTSRRQHARCQRNQSKNDRDTPHH